MYFLLNLLLFNLHVLETPYTNTKDTEAIKGSRSLKKDYLLVITPGRFLYTTVYRFGFFFFTKIFTKTLHSNKQSGFESSWNRDNAKIKMVWIPWPAITKQGKESNLF